MIREFEQSKLDDIDPLINRFMEQTEEGAVPPDFGEQVKKVNDSSTYVWKKD